MRRDAPGRADGVCHPRLFWQKWVELSENKGHEFLPGAKKCREAQFFAVAHGCVLAASGVCHPGCFAQRVWKMMKMWELGFQEGRKSAQECESKGHRET